MPSVSETEQKFGREGGRTCQGLHVSRHVTAAGQTRVKPQARGPRAGSCEARLLAPFSSLSHPRDFLARVGEVGIESLSPDSFPDLVGCYPVIFQISFHGPLLATQQCHPRRQKRGKRRREQTTYLFPPDLRIPTTDKFLVLMVLGTTQDISYKINKIISHCYTQRLAIFQIDL